MPSVTDTVSSTRPPAPLIRHFIGLMSGTSMDGVDGVIATFGPLSAPSSPRILSHAHVPFDAALREAFFALQSPGEDEIAREAFATQVLADVYGSCCDILLRDTGLSARDVTAIGAHGQTIRHRPERGYTRQSNDPARLAERTGIDVVADFRSRDVAAGGQGAPLVPAFHADVFGVDGRTRVICNIGGISNVSILDGRHAARGFDCGPGNALMDAWAERTIGTPYDVDGQLARAGRVDVALLSVLLQEPFLDHPPPKSTGRDLFNIGWLDAKLANHARLQAAPPAAADVQATLAQFTAIAIARDIGRYAPACDAVYVCGGGACNPTLMAELENALRAVFDADGRAPPSLQITDTLGIDAQQVEALAFAWLAMRFVERLPGNLPAVTGARGLRVLGALYPR